MSALLTFSGKYGDILWSLLAAREKSRSLGQPVDFGVMPRYSAVLPLIHIQPYVRRAIAIDGWEQVHDGMGAQPRVPPQVPGGYSEVNHLTYASPPQEPLALHGLKMLGLPLPQDPLPFIYAEAEPEPDLVAYAWNDNYAAEKQSMLEFVQGVIPSARYADVRALPFDEAGRKISAARFFLGCRSSNWVVAAGLGKRCLIYEPDGGRRTPIFGFPWAKEHMPDPNWRQQFAEFAIRWMEGEEE
jgi:hypothetical protein